MTATPAAAVSGLVLLKAPEGLRPWRRTSRCPPLARELPPGLVARAASSRPGCSPAPRGPPRGSWPVDVQLGVAAGRGVAVGETGQPLPRPEESVRVDRDAGGRVGRAGLIEGARGRHDRGERPVGAAVGERCPCWLRGADLPVVLLVVSPGPEKGDRVGARAGRGPAAQPAGGGVAVGVRSRPAARSPGEGRVGWERWWRRSPGCSY